MQAIPSQWIENILDFKITSQNDKHTTDHHRYYKVQWKPTWVSEAGYTNIVVSLLTTIG